MNLANCDQCGKVFVKSNISLCGACVKLLEEQYQKCVDYIRENRNTNLQQLSEATGISTKQIIIFIREGRISMADNPNLTYPCEVCSTPIREGHMCEPCRSRLVHDFKAVSNSDTNHNGNTSHRKETTYRALDKFK